MAHAPDDGQHKPLVTFRSRVAQAGFTMVPNVVLLRADLKPISKLMYGYLGHLAWKGASETVAETVADVAADLSVSEETARSAMRELRHAPTLEGDTSENAEMLVVAKRRGLGKPNVYEINEPRLGSSTSTSKVLEPKNPAVLPSSKTLEAKTDSDFVLVQATELPDDVPWSRVGKPPKLISNDGGQSLAYNAIAKACDLAPGDPLRASIAVALNGDSRNLKARPGINRLFWLQTAQAFGKSLSEVSSLADANPMGYQDALERVIFERASRFPALFPRTTLTPTALAKWWLKLGGERPGEGVTGDQVGRMEQVDGEWRFTR